MMTFRQLLERDTAQVRAAITNKAGLDSLDERITQAEYRLIAMTATYNQAKHYVINGKWEQ